MRFLIGILTGAAMTLFIATAVDAPTNPVLASATERFHGVWDSLIEATSDTLFRNPETETNQTPSIENARTAELDRIPPALYEPEQYDPEQHQPDSAIELPIVESGEFAEWAESVGTIVPESVGTTVPGSVGTSVPGSVATLDVPAATNADAVVKPEAEPEFDNGRWFLETEASTLATVWVPFHSQMSAEGFADRLSRELEYPFRVQRQGPGNYQVVFDAESGSEREALLARIAEVTGQ